MMVATPDYHGPDRRGDEWSSLRTHVDGLIAAQNRHFDDMLTKQTAHFDRQISELHLSVDPMHAYFTVAKTNLAIIKWLVAVSGGVIAAWHFVREWLR